MEKKTVYIRDEFIKLGQAMKLADLVSSGLEAKEEIQAGHVKVNGETELRRGRKLKDSDQFSYGNYLVEVKEKESVKDGVS